MHERRSCGVNQTPKNPKEEAVVAAQNEEMACLANQEQVFLSLDQSGLSNFALAES